MACTCPLTTVTSLLLLLCLLCRGCNGSAQDYTIRIQTSHDQHSGVDGDVYIELHGESGGGGASNFLSSGFETGSFHSFTFTENALGNISWVKVYVGMGSYDQSWKVDYIRVEWTYPSNGYRVFNPDGEFQAGQWKSVH